MNEYSYASTTDRQEGLRAYLNGVFVKMGIAMAITAGVCFLGYWGLISGNAIGYAVYNLASGVGAWVLLLAQLGICIFLSARISSMSPTTCTALFYGYAALTGVTFSVLPLYYGVSTVFTSFLFAAVMFFCAAILGRTTNVDLSKFRGLFTAGLIALIIASVLSFFIPALADNLAITYFAIILFLALTAWDMQNIIRYYYGTNGGQGNFGVNLSTYGAFSLYLDFINLFLRILQIFGRNSRRD